MMRKALYPLLILAFLAGCFRPTVRPGRTGLEIIYLASVPKDSREFAGLKQVLAEVPDDALIVVDGKDFTDLADLAWWEARDQIFLLEQLGCDLYLPPSSWQLLGARELAQISSNVEFFSVAVNLVDSEGRYPLPRYMIRQQSPYRLSFSAAIGEYPDLKLAGLELLPLDSILPVTASFLGLQTDFFIYFSKDSIADLPPNTHLINRGDSDMLLDFRFTSRTQFKLKESSFQWEPSDTLSPAYLWGQVADSLDAEILYESETYIPKDSLGTLALEAMKRLAPEGSGVIMTHDLFTDSLLQGKITFGRMRKIMKPEIYFAADSADVMKVIEDNLTASIEAEVILLPLSLVSRIEGLGDVPLRPTGITSRDIAGHMFNLEEEDER